MLMCFYSQELGYPKTDHLNFEWGWHCYWEVKIVVLEYLPYLMTLPKVVTEVNVVRTANKVFVGNGVVDRLVTGNGVVDRLVNGVVDRLLDSDVSFRRSFRFLERRSFWSSSFSCFSSSLSCSCTPKFRGLGHHMTYSCELFQPGYGASLWKKCGYWFQQYLLQAPLLFPPWYSGHVGAFRDSGFSITTPIHFWPWLPLFETVSIICYFLASHLQKFATLPH